MAWEGIDQRKFPRVRYKCRIGVLKENRDTVIDTFTENIGAGGICVNLEKSLKLFEKVGLEVFLDETELPVKCEGTVMWVVKRHPTDNTEKTRYDTGIEFTGLPEESRGKISRLVENILETRT